MQENDSLKYLQQICQAIVDKKGMNILVLDVKKISTMTDYFIIAEGSVERHIVALAEYVKTVASQHGIKAIHVEGTSSSNLGSDWAVLDFFDIVVHIFTPEMRYKYCLEEIWNAGTVLSLSLDYGRPAA